MQWYNFKSDIKLRLTGDKKIMRVNFNSYSQTMQAGKILRNKLKPSCKVWRMILIE